MQVRLTFYFLNFVIVLFMKEVLVVDYVKISEFIKKLRKEKKWSQEQLASKLFVDTSTINRWEKGKRYPRLDDLYKLSEIFDISLNELLIGERITKENKTQIRMSLYKYLKSIIKKMNKLKIILLILSLILIITFILLASIYFLENYNSIYVYKFFGSSATYKVENGLLILSKNKIYFQIGDINPIPQKISIYRIFNDERKLIYQGNYQNIISDNYGYNALISYKDFIHNKQSIILEINNEEIKLNFVKDFVNNDFINFEDKNIGVYSPEDDIDEIKIQKAFVCDEQENCSLDTSDAHISYSLGILSVMEKDILYNYDIQNHILNYFDFRTNQEYIWKIENKDIVCLSDKCVDTQNIINQFQQKYLNQYLK